MGDNRWAIERWLRNMAHQLWDGKEADSVILPPVCARRWSKRLVKAADALASPTPGDGWRDIAEHDGNGEPVLLSKWVGNPDHPSACWWVTRGWWTEKYDPPRWWDGVEPSGLAGPTHFMPLPPPPRRDK